MAEDQDAVCVCLHRGQVVAARALPPSPPQRYCFQAWRRSDKLKSETYANNDSMAQWLQVNLGPEFAQLLHVRGVRPMDMLRRSPVPLTVLVSLRPDMHGLVDELDLITSFRDTEYRNLVEQYLQNTECGPLEFYNCFVTRNDAIVWCDAFNTVVIVGRLNQRQRRALRSLPKRTRADVCTTLAVQTFVTIPKRSAEIMWEWTSSLFQNNNSNTGHQNHGPGPAHANAKQPEPDPGFFQRRFDATRELFEWLQAQASGPPADATAGTANSYSRFKEHTRDFIALLNPVANDYTQAQTRGEKLQLSDVWQYLVRGSDVQHHGAQLIANLNQTELLEAIVARHSAVKSAACGLGAVAGACGAVGSGYKAYIAYTAATGPWGWLTVAVICVGVAAVSAYKASEHNEYRNRCIDVREDMNSFQKAWTDVVRAIAVAFADAAGIGVDAANRQAANEVCRSVGLDPFDIGNPMYATAQMKARVEYLDKTFKELTENLDWLDQQERLSLNRGQA